MNRELEELIEENRRLKQKIQEWEAFYSQHVIECWAYYTNQGNFRARQDSSIGYLWPPEYVAAWFQMKLGSI